MENFELLECKDSGKIAEVLSKARKQGGLGYVVPILDERMLTEYTMRIRMFDYRDIYYKIGEKYDNLLGLKLKNDDLFTDSFATIICMTKYTEESVETVKNIFKDFNELFEEYQKVICYVSEENNTLKDFLKSVGFEKEATLNNEFELNKKVELYSYFL